MPPARLRRSSTSGSATTGSGYYRVRPEDIPLAAHFLILADAFDAMTTEKPFRQRLTREEAFAEIESGMGTQFHPVIAKAFIAVQRGQDPASVVSADELAAIRDTSISPSAAFSTPTRGLGRPELVVTAGGGLLLVGLGTGITSLAAAGAAGALFGLKLLHRARKRVSRLCAAIEGSFPRSGDQAQLFGNLVDEIEQAWPLAYAALVDWSEDGAGGVLRLERGSGTPPEQSLISWLLREAESGAEIVVDTAEELPGDGVAIAVPLRRENSALVGFLVLCGDEQPPPHLLRALELCLDPLGVAFAETPQAIVLRPSRTKPRTLNVRRGQARTLEA